MIADGRDAPIYMTIVFVEGIFDMGGIVANRYQFVKCERTGARDERRGELRARQQLPSSVDLSDTWSAGRRQQYHERHIISHFGFGNKKK